MTTLPPGVFPRITPSIFYDDAGAAIDWLCRVFGFAIRLRIDGPDGTIAHSELSFADGVVMVSSARGEERKSPRSVFGANTQTSMIYVDDVDAHHARVEKEGGKIVSEPKTTDYGAEYWTDRSYEAEDLEGHRWYFVERLRSAT